MGLLDIFKKKKKTEEKPEQKPEKVPEVQSRLVKAKKKVSLSAYRVLVSPRVTEKATAIEKDNKYVFKVTPRTNKIEIKKAIEGLYGVEVTGVKIINVPKKKRRLGKYEGWRKGYKKAIIKIKKGQKIEIMPK